MANAIFLIVLVVVGVIILAYVFSRSSEEDAQRPAREESAPTRTLASDIDRFLDEVNRRRQDAARRAEGVSTPAAAPPPRRRSVPSREPPRRREAIPTVVPITPSRSAAPVVELVLAEPASRQSRLMATLVEPVESLASLLAAAAPARPSSPQPSAATQQMLAMLRSPHSIRAAILLQEVLGPPKCRRRCRHA